MAKRLNHIAIIPDGNRRWALKNKIPYKQAYEKGIEHILDVMKWCKKHKIRNLTMWGFSTENFARDREEVGGLFELFEKKLSEGLKEDYKKYKIRIRFFGKLNLLPKNIEEKIRKVEEDTKENGKYFLNILLAYGGRQEIVDAVNSILASGKKKIDEKEFGGYLYMNEEPDLIIRTSGEIRTSGFLPWQSAYSEFYFSKKLWPEFDYKEFKKILKDYSKRKRKYGR